MSQQLSLARASQTSQPESKPLNPSENEKAKPWLGPAPKVEQKGLYIFLWDGGAKNRFFWGLFLALGESSGVLFQQILIGKQWQFQMTREDVLTSEGLLAALKVGEVEDINDEWIKAIEDCVRGAKVNSSLGPFTGRTWVLSAVYELADGGFIWLDPDWGKVRHIEEEARRLAHDAVAVEMQIVSQSQMTG